MLCWAGAVSIVVGLAGGAWAQATATNAALPHEPRELPATRLAVAWDDDQASGGFVRAMSTRAPFDWLTPPLGTDRDCVVRSRGPRMYVVSRYAGTVLEVDARRWTPVRTFSLGSASALHDIALAGPGRAYLTRLDATRLLRLDLQTGQTAEVVDLGAFADADGVPDLGMMAVHEGRLFVQIRRFNSSAPYGFAPPAYLAVVDLATEQLVDADSQMPGVQAIRLEGTPPKLKMVEVPERRELVVGATGGFFDAGGLERVDLDGLRSLGLFARESDGLSGADMGPFTMVSPGRGYLGYSTDFTISTHLQRFTVAGGVDDGPTLYDTAGYLAPTIAFDPQSGVFFLPDGVAATPGVLAFDAVSGQQLTPVPTPTMGRPTDLELLPRPSLK